MKLHYVPTITDGVLLSRLGEVHRDIGSETLCGRPIPVGRASSVTHVQAVVFKLALCRDCYPDHHHSHKLPANGHKRGRA